LKAILCNQNHICPYLSKTMSFYSTV